MPLQITKMQKFLVVFSRFWNPGTAGVDAFFHDWWNDVAWVVPPIPLVLRVLQFIFHSASQGTLVVPHWPSAAYWPLLVNNFARFITNAIILKGNIALTQGTNLHPCSVPNNGRAISWLEALILNVWTTCSLFLCARRAQKGFAIWNKSIMTSKVLFFTYFFLLNHRVVMEGPLQLHTLHCSQITKGNNTNYCRMATRVKVWELLPDGK